MWGYGHATDAAPMTVRGEAGGVDTQLGSLTMAMAPRSGKQIGTVVGNAGVLGPSGLAGLVGLCFWLQLGLQNLYVACIYQDHVVRDSTVISSTFLAGVLLSAVVALLFARRASFSSLRRVCLAAVPALLALLAVRPVLVAGLQLPATVLLAGGLGVFTTALMLLWAHVLRALGPVVSLRSLMAANLVALASLFALFAWFGEIVWFDFRSPCHGGVLKAVTALAGFVACVACPAPSERALDRTGQVAAWAGCGADSSWRNFALAEWKLYLGLALFGFCTPLHWEVNAMRNGKSLALLWTWFGHDIAATGMAFCYFVLAAAVCTLGFALLCWAGSRFHLHTLATILFYATGCAFSIPGLLGFDAISPAGIAVVGMTLYSMFCAVLLCRRRPLAEVPLSAAFALYVIVLSVSLGCGLVVSWAIAPAFYGSDAFCIALTALSLFLVMTGPDFLFKASVPSMAPVADAEQDALALRCRGLAIAHGLTPREAEVAELAARGYSAPAIASNLFISESTVKVHMRHIYEKLGLHSKQELIRLARGDAASPRS